MSVKYLNPDFINTSESYSGEILVGNYNLVVPYININIMPDNPINQKPGFVDYSYYCFKDVYSSLFGSGSLIIDVKASQKDEITLTEYIAVTAKNNNNGGAEIRITCKENFFLLLDNFAISNVRYIPFNTPNFKGNMNNDKVYSFFKNKFIPDEIIEFLGEKHYQISI